MRFASRFKFFLGITILLILFLSYFLRFNVEIGANYVTEDTLLGLLIFHNFFVLILYLLISAWLIVSGIKRIKIS